MAVTLTNADIVSRLKMLGDYHLKADSGSTTTAVNSTLIGEARILNSFACFLTGDNIGLDRVITGFDDTTGTITFDALGTAITNTDEFAICTIGFQSDIAQASLEIANDFRNKGYDINNFLTTSQLEEMYISKTLEIICSNLMNDGNEEDVYFVQYNRFKKKYETEQLILIADYDANEDGSISTEEELGSIGQVGFSR